MANKLNKLGSKTGITLCSSAAVLIGALMSHQAFAQEDETFDTDYDVTYESEELESESLDSDEVVTEESDVVKTKNIEPGYDVIVEEDELKTETIDADGNATLDAAEVETTVTETATEQSDDDVEEIMVYGIKQSLSTAQDIKRDAATVVDAVTASDITSLPDKSVVDALTRVPGVTVEVFEATDDPEHFGAEGSTALVRGLDRTLTQFNGRTSFSANQYGALNLGDIPSELVAAIEVQKNQTASMIEGGIAGTLNLVTRKPFDSDGMEFGGSIKVDYADLAEEWSPNISGLFSNRWETSAGEFGALFSLSWSNTYSASQSVGTHNYYERSSRRLDAEARNVELAAAGEPEIPIVGTELEYVADPYPGQAAGTVLWQPPSFQLRYKEDERERLGFVSSFQWQNTDETLKATLEFIRSDSHASWNERLVQNKDQIGDNATNADVATVLEIPGLSGVNESFDPVTGLFTHGVLSQGGASDYGYAPETRVNDSKNYVNDLSLDIEWKVNDNLTINSDVQYVDSGLRLFDHTIHSFFRTDVWLDLRVPESPQVGILGEGFHLLSPTEASSGSGSFFEDANGNLWGGDLSSITDPANILTRSAMDHDTESNGDALAFSMDADYEFDEGWVTNVKVGARFSHRNQLHKSSEYAWGVISPEWSDTHARWLGDYSDASLYPQFQEQFDFGNDFYRGDAFVPGSVTAFYLPKVEWVDDLNAFQRAYEEIVPIEYDPDADNNTDGPDDDPTWYYSTTDNGSVTTFTNNEFVTEAGKQPGSPFSPYDFAEVEERSAAAYVQMDFDFIDLPMPIRGNVGVRFVNIGVKTSGFRIFETPEEAGTWGDGKRYNASSQKDSLPDDIEAYIEYNRLEYERALAAGDTPVYQDPATLEWLNGSIDKIVARPERVQEALPSLNLTMNFTENLLLRFAASKALYIPDLSLKRPSVRYGADVSVTPVEVSPTGWDQNERGRLIDVIDFQDYSASTVGGSNPYLLPEESINIDLGLEWYFSEVGSITGVLFTKDMDNLIRKTTITVDDTNPISGVTKEFVLADTFLNVGSGRIDGFEISYQQTFDMLPGFWSGLGVQTNYTRLYTEEEIDVDVELDNFGTFIDLPLEGLSPESYNMIAFYENEHISTRLAYNFRSEYMLSSRDVIGKRPVFNKDRGVLDYSFTYTFESGIKAGFDVNNLTNEQTLTEYQYNAAGDTHPRNFFINDRRVTFRVSGSF